MAPSSKGTRGGKAVAPRLSRERRHVLRILARSGHLGVTEAILMTYGFSTAMLAGMVSDGFVTVAVETVWAGDRNVKVRAFRMTDVGRKAVAANTRTSC
jgi:hypothetical protein